MTTPDEELRALLRAEEFISQLAMKYGGKYKRVPGEVRDMARHIIRHFPTQAGIRRAWKP